MSASLNADTLQREMPYDHFGDRRRRKACKVVILVTVQETPPLIVQNLHPSKWLESPYRTGACKLCAATSAIATNKLRLTTSNIYAQTSEHLRVCEVCLHVNFVIDLNWKTFT